MSAARLTLPAVLLSAVAAPAPPASAAPELKTLHLLVVADTADPNLETSVKIDQGRVLHMFKENVPADRLTVSTVTGAQVTPDGVRAAVRRLAPGPSDAVVFYYAGHGGQDAGGLFFAAGYNPAGGRIPRLYRREVVSALQAGKPGLVVLLSDCCSNRLSTSRGVLKADPDKQPPLRDEEARGLANPNVRKLFFEARGLVDVTAATDDVAWGTDVRGGCFTYTFVSMVRNKAAEVSGWKEAVEKARTATPTLHKDLVQRGHLEQPVGGGYQVPKAYALGDPAGPRYAVISFQNPADSDVTLGWRWSGAIDWRTLTVRAKDRQHVYVRVGADAPLPQFEVNMKGNTQARFLARPYDGPGLPRFDDGKVYTVRPPAKK